MSYQILIVDDEKEFCVSLSELLKDEGYEALYTVDPRETLSILAREQVQLVIMDVRMPWIGGIDLLKLVHRSNPETKVIILTGHPSVDNAVQAMKYGAVNFYEKPPRLATLFDEIRELAARAERDASNLVSRGKVITRDAKMRKVLASAEKAAQTNAPVLITGETGTGKELIANLVHTAGPRSEHSFVKVNCAAIPETLLESELFGHERGAFTNAIAQRKGKFELADHGTIFLDEIGDMASGTQAKILRVLQEQEFERVGGSETVNVDLRIIAATNKDLPDLIEKGLFREDLYYRLCVISLHLPPLRERQGDVELLMEHFIHQFGERYGKHIAGLEGRTRRFLLDHTWPGNVRELRNCIERAVIFCEGERISLEDLPAQYTELRGGRHQEELRMSFDNLQRRMILQALEKSKGVKSKAADMLEIDRRTLYNRIKKLGLD